MKRRELDGIHARVSDDGKEVYVGGFIGDMKSEPLIGCNIDPQAALALMARISQALSNIELRRARMEGVEWQKIEKQPTLARSFK